MCITFCQLFRLLEGTGHYISQLLEALKVTACYVFQLLSTLKVTGCYIFQLLETLKLMALKVTFVWDLSIGERNIFENLML